MGKEKQIKKNEVTSEGFEVIEDNEVFNLNSFRGGMDFYLQGGKNEAQSIFKRLLSFKNKHITREDIKRLKKLEQPPQPDFEVKTLDEVRAMGRFEKKSYKSNMEAFEKRRAAWDKTEAGMAWNSMLAELTGVSQEELFPKDELDSEEIDKEIKADIKNEKKAKAVKVERFKKNNKVVKKKQKDYSKITDRDIGFLEDNELDEYIDFKTKELNYQEIKEDPDEMDAMLVKQEDEEFRQQEALISNAEIRKAYRHCPRGDMAANYYIMNTGASYAMNDYYRKREKRAQSFFAPTLHRLLSSTSISRDIVSRRSVRDVQTLAHMMGLENASKLTADEIRKIIEDKIENNETITLHEKGFCSTSTSTGGYFADAKGIEFVILNKKGTNGINYTCNGSKGAEDELLLDAGTKFKVLKVYFNGKYDEKRKNFHGAETAWKVYLVTIPGANEVQVPPEDEY